MNLNCTYINTSYGLVKEEKTNWYFFVIYI